MIEFREDLQRKLYVQRLGVFELRALAREVGISSPTTKKRDELIDLILQAFDKGLNQDVKIQKRGRPFKKLNALDDILGSVIDDNKEFSYENVITFAQEEKPVVTFSGSSGRFEGICSVSDKGVIIRSLTGNEKIFVGDVYGAEKLENGDIVEVNAQKISEYDDYQALSISLINGQSALSYQKSMVEVGEEIISTNQLAFGNYHVIEGRRNACLLQNDLYETGYLRDLKQYCDDNDAVLVVVGTNTSYENQIILRQLKIKYNFTSPYGTNAKLNLNKTIDALNFAEACFKNEKKVVLFVMDLGGLVLGLDENFEKTSQEHSKEAEIIVKKMFSLAGCYETGHSLTLVMCYSDIDLNDKFITTDLLRVCKKS